ncbi:uncharacterized protein LOC127873328 [Dreissena polymorpha]|uniref:Nucleolus and neural progenitor protein-like N-terminal domain-containing protein n=1 Tax=Dreissena polymorpha TaxID=45954 RepID=A0A9D4QWV4_DREPO|nr:uncharacterized protein LOC127873328 [Dreissena polymorpha]XP_052273123.1 uncharacterized protein LOC127873328 [Dreissena polymorpha]XP_052273124.1 uncharacterized protein LOC127873328 [Dreissena polymorpha]XP_052273125.1 uncharacterized protein LOC127873328 [Dreissena polymorpha]KAH3846524.1 hypothetical protein DPMN_088826 [Dreissena polymorpha]
MWNRKSLAAPPVCELKVTLTQRNRDALNKALRNFNTAKDVLFEHEGFLASEQYIMRKTVYKLANQFRSEKSLRGVRQVLSCLRRMQDMQPGVLLETIKEYVNINSSHEEEQYLVSLQTVQYHLVRLQGLAALLQQTVNYCVYTFFHIRQHMEAGKMAPQNIVMLSGIARIWYVCSSLCDYVCNWYRALHLCLDVFQSTQVVWLEKSLPSDLKQWLGELFPEEKSEEFSPRIMTEHLRGTDKKHVTVPEYGPQSIVSSNSLGEDIGEPIRRQKDVTAVETATQHAKTKKKGQKKILKIEQKKDIKMQDNDKSAAILADVSVQTLKLAIKQYMRTKEDLSRFKAQVKKRYIELNGSVLRISKLGKKKILKKIALLTEKVHKEFDVCSEKVVIKKIRLPISKLIVKYLENSVTDKKLAVASTLAVKKDIPVDCNSEVLNNNVEERNKVSNAKKNKLGKISKTKQTKVGKLKSDKVMNIRSKKKSKKNKNKVKRLK